MGTTIQSSSLRQASGNLCELLAALGRAETRPRIVAEAIELSNCCNSLSTATIALWSSRAHNQAMPTEHDARNARKWDARAETFDQKRFDYFRWMQRKALAYLDIKAGIHFLDLGCGTGQAVRHVAERARGDGVFCGIDISPRMIDIARETKGLPNVQFEVASAEELPFEDGSFGAALCTNSFHHYLLPMRALEEIHRVLRPGGRLCILDITSDSLLGRWLDARLRRKEREHVKFYSTSDYAKMFRATGLKVVVSKRIWPPLKAHIAEKE